MGTDGVATLLHRASWIAYKDEEFQVWSAQGYATGESPDYEFTLVNPVSITTMDAGGKVLEQISAIRASTAGRLSPEDSFPQSSYCRWTTNQYTDCCFAASRRVYHTIPSSGEGESGTNYDETNFGYDVMKRQNRTVTPGGTITYRVFDIASSLLKSKEIYPDSVDEDDVIRFEYNRQSQTTKITDQAGKVHEYDYDLLGRQTQDRVTALGVDVDDAVLRIETTYEVRGMKEHVTSWDNPNVGEGAAVNDCLFTYNDFSQLKEDYQSHDGEVDIETTPKVRYVYADGSNNTTRQTQLIYPNGRELNNSYGTEDGIDDVCSRVYSLIDDDGSSHLVDYSYLGHQMFVITDYPEPQTRYTLIGTAGGNDPDTGDIYRGLDRFGRIKDSYWYNYGNTTDTDRIKYGYDRTSNRIWRENVVATAAGKEFDELYHYDQIHRLKDMRRGLLSGSYTTLTSSTSAQCWTLDETGNWHGFRDDYNRDGTWDLIQIRNANAVNEIAQITESEGPSWDSPVYSRAGEMTLLPQPQIPESSYTAKYDAWHRLSLVTSVATHNAVSSYLYDGRGYSIVSTSFSSTLLTSSTNTYWDRFWRPVEELTTVSGETELVTHDWGLRYIDDLISSNDDIQRVYCLQDASWNTTTSLSSEGAPLIRYAYTPFGQFIVMDMAFVKLSINEAKYICLFSGRTFDVPTGLWQFRNRMLHPVLGVFVSRDPLFLSAGPNIYACTFPVNYVDPLGLASRSYQVYEMATDNGHTPSSIIAEITVTTEVDTQHCDIICEKCEGFARVNITFQWKSSTPFPDHRNRSGSIYIGPMGDDLEYQDGPDPNNRHLGMTATGKTFIDTNCTNSKVKRVAHIMTETVSQFETAVDKRNGDNRNDVFKEWRKTNALFTVHVDVEIGSKCGDVIRDAVSLDVTENGRKWSNMRPNGPYTIPPTGGLPIR